MKTAMGPLDLMVAKSDDLQGEWRLVLCITARVPIEVGERVATAMTADDAEHLIHALRRGITDLRQQDGRKPD